MKAEILKYQELSQETGIVRTRFNAMKSKKINQNNPLNLFSTFQAIPSPSLSQSVKV